MKEVEFASIVASEAPPMEKARLKQLKKDIRSFVEKYPNSKYFTLMGQPVEGKQNRYVTIFNMSEDRYKSVVELQEFLVDENPNYLGVLKGYLEQENYMELWYDSKCYLFFEYQNGVIELGK